jgi:hypothetical protein
VVEAARGLTPRLRRDTGLPSSRLLACALRTSSRAERRQNPVHNPEHSVGRQKRGTVPCAILQDARDRPSCRQANRHLASLRPKTNFSLQPISAASGKRRKLLARRQVARGVGRAGRRPVCQPPVRGPAETEGEEAP